MINASYYVIYYEKFRKIMQRTEKEALNINHAHSLDESSQEKPRLVAFLATDRCWYCVTENAIMYSLTTQQLL